ncbi:DUF4179 domain-containing protein [Lacticaseibacillus absianus]|uniref:DUF4179 domain-containing protein n=1 Tax=Lacticaseibacillus absianus TaxID=2729623 RepID=UPI0015CCD781|nr:DUF4179 domain-containing protein [Lacticaseibacillus absianus]
MADRSNRQVMHDRFDQIPVPRAAVAAAITRGVKAAPLPHRLRKQLLAAAAALMLGTAGLAAFNPVVGQAFDNAAWLSSFYLLHGDRDHFNTFHVTGVAKGLNQTVTSHGLTVHLTEAYYAGATVGVTGEITGMTAAQRHMNGEDELSLAVGDTGATPVSLVSSDFQATKTGYRFRLRYDVTAAPTPSALTLPLHVTHIGPVAGRWSFNLKLHQPAPVVTTLGQQGLATGAAGVTFTPLTMTTDAHGAALRYRMTVDRQRDEPVAEIVALKDAAGHDLIDRRDGLVVHDAGAVNTLPLKQALVSGQAYTVTFGYTPVGGQHDERVALTLVLVP